MPAHPFGFGPFLVEHPKDLLATLVGLILLALLLYRFAVPGAKGMLTERATRIETETTQIDRQLRDIAQLRTDYANRIGGIEAEQRERIAAAVRDADNARADIIADANEAARLVQRRGEEEIERERTRQRIIMRQQMVQITLDAAEQAIRTQNNDQVQRNLIRNFIAQVADKGNEGGNGQNDGFPASMLPVASAVVQPQSASAAVSQPPVASETSAAAPIASGAMAFGTPTPGTTTEDTTFPDFNSFSAPTGQEEA